MIVRAAGLLVAAIVCLLATCSKLPIAAKCVTADQCESATCVVAVDPSAGGICATTCATSAQCDTGYECRNVKRCASDPSAAVYACIRTCTNASDCFEETTCTTVGGSLGCFTPPPSTPCP